MPSRFLQEIPEDCVVQKGRKPAAWQSGGWTDSSGGQSGYAPKHTPERKKPSYDSAPSVPMLELRKGDMVNHTAFGRGMVLTVVKVGGDALVEIAFDQIGTKKLLLKTASAHMKKL